MTIESKHSRKRLHSGIVIDHVKAAGRLLSVLLVNLSLVSSLLADDWPQWRGVHRDGTWNESGVLERFPKDGLEIKWRVPIGSGYSGPTVAEGRVFVMDRVTEPKQLERIHCVDEKTGEMLWSYEYDCIYTISYQAGPRASISVEDGKIYALGAMGHIHCLDAANGKVIWKRDLNQEYEIKMPIWGISASPLLWNESVILQIGGKGACVLSLSQDSGEELWKALDDRAGYSAPILTRQGETEVAICWTGDGVAGIAPGTGKVLWRIPWAPRNMPIGIATPIIEKNRLFLSSFYDGSHMIELSENPPNTKTLWLRVGRDERNTDALQSIISTPLFMGDHVYGVDSYGELRCLKASNGDRVWEDQTATPRARWSTIHFVKNGDDIWMLNERGELIIGRLSPEGFKEIDRAKLIEPTTAQLRQRQGVCWSHPAFANRHVFARNDREMVCASLEK